MNYAIAKFDYEGKLIYGCEICFMGGNHRLLEKISIELWIHTLKIQPGL